MLFRKLTIILVSIISATAFAEDQQPIDLDDPKPLIMQKGYHLDTEFTDEKTSDVFSSPETPANQPNLPGTSDDALTNYCNKLLDTIDKLKDKPQMRWAARERYKVECQAVFERTTDINMPETD